MKVVFLIGSPRSGTTILENILNCHENIAELYEPYYLWEKFFCADKSDVWQNEKISDRQRENMTREFSLFSRKSKKTMVLDKSPTHSFNIPIVSSVFPKAFWIHIVRDGRDVTLSIRKEWEKRKKMIGEKDFFSLFKTARAMLDRQPFLRYKLMAILHELENSFSFNPYHYLNKSRWKGKVGWGPRFAGWENYLNQHSELEFNAMQWVKSVESVTQYWSLLPRDRKIEVRYESLLLEPEKVICDILNFLDTRPSHGFFEKIPLLINNNFHKWEQEFSRNEIERINPILLPMLKDFKYGCA